jgi:hypothetical protein
MVLTKEAATNQQDDRLPLSTVSTGGAFLLQSLPGRGIISRRRFIQLSVLAGAGGALAACGAESGSVASRTTLNLFRGEIPQDWQSLSREQFFQKLEDEFATDVLPVLCSFGTLGCAPTEVSNKIRYATTDQEAYAIYRSSFPDGIAKSYTLDNNANTIFGLQPDGQFFPRMIVINLATLERNFDPPNGKLNETNRGIFVQGFMEVATEEVIHETLETDHKLSIEQSDRLKKMYASYNIPNIRDPNYRFNATNGTRLNYGPKDNIAESEGLDIGLSEVALGYISNTLRKQVGLPTDPRQVGTVKSSVDMVSYTVTDYLHRKLGITPEAFSSAYKAGFINLVDLYLNKARLKGVILRDQDVALLFNHLGNARNAIVGIHQKSQYREGMEGTVSYDYLREIDKIIPR